MIVTEAIQKSVEILCYLTGAIVFPYLVSNPCLPNRHKSINAALNFVLYQMSYNVIMQVNQLTESCRLPTFGRNHTAGSFIGHQYHILASSVVRKRNPQFK